MVDRQAYEARPWAEWQVFLLATFAMALAFCVLVRGWNPLALRLGDLFLAALYGGIAVAGLGYQQVRGRGAFGNHGRPPSPADP